MKLTIEEYRARQRAYKRKNKERVNARNRAYRQKNREKFNALQREWRQKNKEKAKRFDREYRQKNKGKLQTYGRDQWKRTQRLREMEAGRRRPSVCEVCGKKGRIVFDHCHQRGIFRGWLCSRCNIVLGLVKDDTNPLRKLIAYLERTKNYVSPQLELPI
jgi:hypothetical protein